jgi:hypothetical protein
MLMRWSYKTVLYELKKEGLLGSAFLDESEMEKSLNDYGKAGWELISMLETLDGLIAVFKQPLSLDSGSFYPRQSAGEDVSDQGIAEGEGIVLPSGQESGPRRDVAVELPDDLVLVDEYEIVKDIREPADRVDGKGSKSPVDIGTIRIE